MKKIISILLTFTILACSMPVIFATGGTGTESDPYLISSVADLKTVSAADSEGKYYKLTNDIDLANVVWPESLYIGTEDAPFKGIFDGNGYAIKNYRISIGNAGVGGLFKYIGGNAVIKNLGIEAVEGMLNTWSYHGVVGGLTAYLTDNATLQNCWAKNIIFNDHPWGEDKSDVGNFGQTGGLVAVIDSENVTVENCYSVNSNGSAYDGKADYDGGIVGYITAAATIRNCYSDTTVASLDAGVTANVEKCYMVEGGHWTSNGAISYIGEVVSTDVLKTKASDLGSAFIGMTMFPAINNGYPILECQRAVAAELSKENPAIISSRADLKNLQSFVANDAKGAEGFTFKLGADIDLNDAWWQSYIGTADVPFKGIFDGNGYVIRNIKLSIADKGVAGLFLYIGGNAVIKNLGIEDLYATLNTWSYNGVVGGVAAYATGNATVQNCYVRGATLGDHPWGETSSDVGNFGKAGGLIGYINSAGVTVENCYAIDSIPKTYDSTGGYDGGLVGYVDVAATIRNCYSDTTIALGSTSAGVTVEKCYFAESDHGTGDGIAYVGTVVAADQINLKAADLGAAFIMDSPYNPVNGGYPMFVSEREKLAELNYETPGVIDSKADFLALSSMWASDPYGLDGMYFELGADIDLTNEQMQYYLIGSEEKPFKGELNGNGHVVKNYKFSSWDWKNGKNLSNCKYGLFSYIGGNAHIYNMGVENIAVLTAAGWFINTFGGLVAVMLDNSAVTGCYAKNVDFSPEWDFEGWNPNWDNGATKAGINYGAGLIGLLDGPGVEVRQCYATNIDDSRVNYTNHKGEAAVFGLVMRDAGVFGHGNNFLKVADCYSDTYVGAHKSSLYIDNCYQQHKHTEWYTGDNWGAWQTNVKTLSDRWCDDFYITGDGQTFPMLKWEKGNGLGLNLVKGGTMNIAEDDAKALFGAPDAKIVNGATTAYVASMLLELPAENVLTYTANLEEGSYYKVSFRGSTVDNTETNFVFTLGETDLTEKLVDKTLGDEHETKSVYVKAAATGEQTLTIDAEKALYLDDVEIIKVDAEYEKKAIGACIGLNHYKVDALESDMYVDSNVYDGVDIIYTSENDYFNSAGELVNLPSGLGRVADKFIATANIADLSVSESIDVNVKMVEPYSVISINLVDANGDAVYDIKKAAKVESVTVKKNETETIDNTKIIVAAYNGETITNVKAIDAAIGDVHVDLDVAGTEKVKVYTIVTDIAKPLSYVEFTYDSLGDEDAIEIHTIGDSIVTDYAETDALRGWGQMLQKYFNADNVTVDNSLSRGGMSAKEFIESADRFEKLLPKLDKNDYVLIQLAHNDTRACSMESYQALVHQLVTGIRDKGAIPVFVTSPATSVSASDAVDESTGKYVVEDRLKGYPQAMRELAAEIGVPVVDLNAHTMELMADLGYTGIINLGYWSTDTVHFGEEGANYLAQFIANSIKDMNLPISDYVIAQ